MSLAGTLGVCLALAAGGPDAAAVFVPATHFTLAWTHSIEKVRWEEDYVVEQRAGAAPLLRLQQARVRGSGAGMEPAPDARLEGGWYVWQPRTAPVDRLLLTRSAYTADYQWCASGRCRAMSELLPADGGVTVLRACTGSN